MSVERIVEAAVEIADADGLGAVSMAAVAARLGYTPMSLYRYVTRQGRPDPAHAGGGDRPAARVRPRSGRVAGAARSAVSTRMIQLYLAHPWVLEVPINGSPTTPNSAAWMDAGLAALDETP